MSPSKSPRIGQESALFLNEGRRLTKTKIHNIHKEYKYRSGFDHNYRFHPHLWRITGITNYARLEEDVKILMKQTRHKDANVLMRYIQLAESEYKNSYETAFEKSEEEHKKPKSTTIIKPKEKQTQQELQTAQQQSIDKLNLKAQLVQRLVKGEITQEVYLIAIKSIEDDKNSNLSYYG